MGEKIDYKSAYEAKKEPKGIYIMNQYCSSVEDDVTTEDIPNILRLYYDQVLTCEQNEFVTVVLDKIVQENPNEAARQIISNIKILKEEQAEECIVEIFLIFIFWYPALKSIFMEELKKSNSENQKFILESMEYLADEENEEEYIHFLKEYRSSL